MPQGFTEMSSCFSQILKADLDDVRFPGSSTNMGMILFASFSSSQASSQEDIIHLLKLFAIKGHSVAKEKLQFAQTQVSYLGYLIQKKDYT